MGVGRCQINVRRLLVNWNSSNWHLQVAGQISRLRVLVAWTPDNRESAVFLSGWTHPSLLFMPPAAHPLTAQAKRREWHSFLLREAAFLRPFPAFSWHFSQQGRPHSKQLMLCIQEYSCSLPSMTRPLQQAFLWSYFRFAIKGGSA